MIKLKLMAVLKEYAPTVDSDGCFAVEYKPGMTIADALSKTSISETTVKYSVLVNNRRKSIDDPLEDGDIVMVMPLLAGG